MDTVLQRFCRFRSIAEGQGCLRASHQHDSGGNDRVQDIGGGIPAMLPTLCRQGREHAGVWREVRGSWWCREGDLGTGRVGEPLEEGGTWTGETKPAFWYREVAGHGEYLNQHSRESPRDFKIAEFLAEV